MKFKAIGLVLFAALFLLAWSRVARADTPLQIALWQNNAGTNLCLGADSNGVTVSWRNCLTDNTTWWYMSNAAGVANPPNTDPVGFSSHQHARSATTGLCLAFGASGTSGPMTQKPCEEAPVQILAASFINGQITSGHQVTNTLWLDINNQNAVIQAGTPAGWRRSPNLTLKQAVVLGINGELLFTSSSNVGPFDGFNGSLGSTPASCATNSQDVVCNTCGRQCYAEPVWFAVGIPGFHFEGGYMDLDFVFRHQTPPLEAEPDEDGSHTQELTFGYVPNNPNSPSFLTPGGISIQGVNPQGGNSCLEFETVGNVSNFQVDCSAPAPANVFSVYWTDTH